MKFETLLTLAFVACFFGCGEDEKELSYTERCNQGFEGEGRCAPDLRCLPSQDTPNESYCSKRCSAQDKIKADEGKDDGCGAGYFSCVKQSPTSDEYYCVNRQRS